MPINTCEGRRGENRQGAAGGGTLVLAVPFSVQYRLPCLYITLRRDKVVHSTARSTLHSVRDSDVRVRSDVSSIPTDFGNFLGLSEMVDMRKAVKS